MFRHRHHGDTLGRTLGQTLRQASVGFLDHDHLRHLVCELDVLGSLLQWGTHTFLGFLFLIRLPVLVDTVLWIGGGGARAASLFPLVATFLLLGSASTTIGGVAHSCNGGKGRAGRRRIVLHYGIEGRKVSGENALSDGVP